MDGPTLQNRISKGWGVSARRTGSPFVVYRPGASANPLSTSNRIIKLNAAFYPINSVATGTTGYTGVLWRGVFDSIYTEPGDYLVGASASFFIASQWPMQPVLCVQTGNLVSVERPLPTISASYSGPTVDSYQPIITGWPSQLVATGGRITGALPESKFENWLAFLPVLQASPHVADVLSDDLGRRFVIGSTQASPLGWRLSMRQVDG